MRPFAELARGSTTVVYKGYEEATGRTVLLKVLTQNSADDPLMVDWFEHEAASVEAIDHPNVVALYDAGRDENGRPFLVTEFVEGASLEDALVEHGPLPPELVAFVGAEVARGLSAAHQAGILHRDIKPANILLGVDGAVKLADFGLATRLSTEDEGDHSDVRGTLGYLAPEAVLGDEAGPAADLFALGATLVEALTGHKAFPATDVREALDSALNHDPIWSLRSDPRIPVLLTNTIGKLLKSDPSDRTTAADTASGLKELAVLPGTDGGEFLGEMLATFLDDPANYQALRPAFTPVQELEAGRRKSRGQVYGDPRTFERRRLPRFAFATAMVLGAIALMTFVVLEFRPAPAVSEAVMSTDFPDSTVVDFREGPTEQDRSQLPSEADVGSRNEHPVAQEATPTEPPQTQSAPDAGLVSEPAGGSPAEVVPSRSDNQATARPGQLTVNVQPWAEVIVDGRKIGEGSRVVVPQLTAGTHEIVLRNPQFPEIRNSVQIQPGAEELLAISLWAHVARITLQVHPWATAVLDGQSIGDVPPEREVILRPGSHTIALTHPQLGTWSGTIRVSAGERRTVPFNLSRLLGEAGE